MNEKQAREIAKYAGILFDKRGKGKELEESTAMLVARVLNNAEAASHFYELALKGKNENQIRAAATLLGFDVEFFRAFLMHQLDYLLERAEDGESNALQDLAYGVSKRGGPLPKLIEENGAVWYLAFDRKGKPCYVSIPGVDEGGS